MGRPKSESSKNRAVKARLSEEEYSMMLEIQSETGELFSEFIRKAIRFYYNFYRKTRR